MGMESGCNSSRGGKVDTHRGSLEREALMLSPALLFACVGFVVYCMLDIVRSLPGSTHKS